MINKKEYAVRMDRSEVLRYLGYGASEPDPAVARQLEEAIRTVERISRPALTYRIFDIVRENKSENESAIRDSDFLNKETPNVPDVKGIPFDNRDESVGLAGTSLILTGRTAELMLRDCSRCVLLAATVGSRVDGEIRRRQIRDMTGALIVDSAAGCAVENICEQFTEDLEQHCGAKGLYITDRFSPGYGDLPLSLQPDILRTLSAEKTIGLTVSSGLLMIPAKSVTALIGIADTPQPRRITGCAHCTMNTTCKYRKAGSTCALS